VGDNEITGVFDMPIPTPTFEQISAGALNVCGLDLDGAVKCWGCETYDHGQCDVPGPEAGPFVQVSSGFYVSTALAEDGTLVSWGQSTTGQQYPEDGDERFRYVSAGAGHSCGIHPDGTVSCWGENEYGEADAPPGEFVQVSAGYNHSCGLRVDGDVLCWGDDSEGQSTPPTDG